MAVPARTSVMERYLILGEDFSFPASFVLIEENRCYLYHVGLAMSTHVSRMFLNGSSGQHQTELVD